MRLFANTGWPAKRGGQRGMNMQAGQGKRASGKCNHREAMEREC